MAVAVRGVFDQFLLGQLEALGLAAAGLVYGLALQAASLVEVEQRVGRFVGHAGTVPARQRRLAYLADQYF
jgi:hypothetical protein